MTAPAGSPAARPAGAVHLAEVATSYDERAAGLRRLHPLTPVFRSWRMIGAATAAGLGAFRDDVERLRWIWRALHGDAELSVMMRAFAVLAVLAAVSGLLAWLSWRATGFTIVRRPREGATLVFQRGLLVRQRSSVRLKRVQSVDVNEPFVPRLVGLAAVRLEMAAGEGASVNLAYLGRSDAQALRAEILQLTGGDVAGGEITAGEAAVGLPDVVIAHVRTPQLVQASLLDGVGWWGALVIWIGGVIVVGLLYGPEAFATAFTAIVPVTIALLLQVRKQVTSVLRDADFTVYRTSSGIRTTAGLTSKTSRTIDFDRLQGVRIEEPWLWRQFGWARAQVDVAGGVHDSEGASLMPVADQPAAFALAREVTGEDLSGVPLHSPGARARLLDPRASRHAGVALLSTGALSRTGWLSRRTSFVPYSRVQSVTVRQGWLQRRLGLVTVYLDPPSGGERWVAPHRDVAETAGLVTELTTRARTSRRRSTGPGTSEPAADPAHRRADHRAEHDAAQQPTAGVEHRPRQVRQPQHEGGDRAESDQGIGQRGLQAHEHQDQHDARDDEARQR